MIKGCRGFITFFKDGLIFFFSLIFIHGCTADYTPKPRGYYKIVFPEKGFQVLQHVECPFQFEYPSYGIVNRDTVFLDTVPDNPCWFNITFPSLNGNLHLSYKSITKKNSLQKMIEDAHHLTFKHTVKANFIEESLLHTPNNVTGILYDVGGNAASSLQFFVTDSTQHFVRGSLYFYNTPNADSMAPVIKFLRPDIVHLISTLKWVE